MNLDTLDYCIVEAEEFIKAAKEMKEKCETFDTSGGLIFYNDCPVERGILKARSILLWRYLAKLRSGK